MEFIIASFRSRAHTIKFYNLLRANGVGVELVNTPKEAVKTIYNNIQSTYPVVVHR